METGLARLKREELSAELDELKLRLAPDVEPSQAATAIEQLLQRRHSEQNDFQLIVPARLMAQHRKTQQIFTIGMCAGEWIALLVGCIVILNIILASLLERKS